MSKLEIKDVIERYAETAAHAESASFTGVRIHSAHGYLFSQFLSPLTNRRGDAWGGSILLETVRAVRARVSPGFRVAVKLNSTDFQSGGFGAEDARRVVEWLNELPVDLVEISGGSYESLAMQGQTRDSRTLAREAYFLEFAEQIGWVAAMPVMLTGGIRRKAVAERVLGGLVSMVGIATALSINPALPRKWQAGKNAEVKAPVVRWRNNAFASVALMAITKQQLSLLSEGKPTNPRLSPAMTLICNQIKTRRLTSRYRKWIAQAGATEAPLVSSASPSLAPRPSES